MSFTLNPSNKNIGEKHISGWKEILDHCGIIIQSISHRNGESVFFERRNGVTPFNNDGFKVSKSEAKHMGRGLILHAEFNDEHPSDKRINQSGDFLTDLGKWMIESKGFTVN